MSLHGYTILQQCIPIVELNIINITNAVEYWAPLILCVLIAVFCTLYMLQNHTKAYVILCQERSMTLN